MSASSLNRCGWLILGIAIGCLLGTHFMRPEPFGGAPDRLAAVLILVAAGTLVMARLKRRKLAI